MNSFIQLQWISPHFQLFKPQSCLLRISNLQLRKPTFSVFSQQKPYLKQDLLSKDCTGGGGNYDETRGPAAVLNVPWPWPVHPVTPSTLPSLYTRPSDNCPYDHLPFTSVVAPFKPKKPSNEDMTLMLLSPEFNTLSTNVRPQTVFIWHPLNGSGPSELTANPKHRYTAFSQHQRSHRLCGSCSNFL